MSPQEVFDFHGLPSFDNYFCAGFFLFNVAKHTELMHGWFEKYQRGINSITGGGDEPHFNYELQNWGAISWLPYEFQALWIYEIAWRYPFLFRRQGGEALIRECIESSLYANHFLHFAGSWHECQMWQVGGFFECNSKKKEIEEYRAYLEVPVTGQQKGIVRPR
jgi:hypothetical protein